MKLKEYAQQARKTAIYPKERGREYVIFGLIDEAGEVSEKVDMEASKQDISDEIGDTMWYLANTIEEFGFNGIYELFEQTRNAQISEGEKFNEYAKYMMQHATKLAGKMKKVMRDEDQIYTDKKLEEIYLIVVSVVNSMICLVSKMNLDFNEIMQNNLDKLFDRKQRGVLKGDGDKR